MANTTEHYSNRRRSKEKSQPIIPGLPDEISELCLYHIPYPYQGPARSVSSSWNNAISHGSFLPSKSQWQVMDPRSGRWFVLPPMPCQKAVCPPSFACASVPEEGRLFVLGGMRSDTGTPIQTMISYRTSTNQWSELSPMPTPRAFFVAGNVDGKIIAVGGCGIDRDDLISTVELYDPTNDTWAEAAKLNAGLAKYDAAVLGSKLYVTEGWTWPFVSSPRGGVYDLVENTWQEMSGGMRDGWTGMSVVLGGRVFVISEHGDCRMKVYRLDVDTWEFVGGDRFPCDALQRPLSVSGVEGRIYVVSSGLNVGIGSVFEENNDKWRVEWKVVEAPKAFHEFSPCNSQLLYA